MSGILAKLTVLCLLAAMGEQLTAGGRLQDGVRMVCALASAGLILDAVLELPFALFGG